MGQISASLQVTPADPQLSRDHILKPRLRGSARTLNSPCGRGGETCSLPSACSVRSGSHQLPAGSSGYLDRRQILRPATRSAFPSSSSSSSAGPSPPAACLRGRRLRLCFPPRFHSPHVILCYCKERFGARAQGARTYKYGLSGRAAGDRRGGEGPGPGDQRPAGRLASRARGPGRRRPRRQHRGASMARPRGGWAAAHAARAPRPAQPGSPALALAA